MKVSWATTRPYDLAAVAVLALLAAAAAMLDLPGWLRVPLGLVFVLALPGYAFVAALYPERHREGVDDVGRRGLQPLERVALSLGLSIAIVPLLGLALNYTSWGIRLGPILITVAGFTLAACAVAAWRRSKLPEDERLLLAITYESEPWGTRTTTDKALTVALVAAVLFASGSLVYVLVAPRSGEAFTEFYVLGPTGKAACYPQTFRDGQYIVSTADGLSGCPPVVSNVTLGIVNHEGRGMTYWLRVLWTKETRLADNTTRVDEVRQANLHNVTLESTPVDLSLGASFTPQYEESFVLPPPPFNGTVRLSFQLFTETPPAATASEGLLESPYRRLHLFITV